MTANGELPALKHLWSNVCVLANHQENYMDFPWDAQNILVPVVCFVCDIFVVCVQIYTHLIIFFQSIVHNSFKRALKDIGHHVRPKGFFFLEFEGGTPFSHVCIHYWKHDSLVRVLLCRFACLGQYPKRHSGTIARILSAL